MLAGVERIEDPIRIRSLLEEAADSRARALFWDSTRTKSPLLRLRESDHRKGTLVLTAEGTLPPDQQWPESSPVYLSVFLPTMAVLCFVAEVRTRKEGRIEVAFPARAFCLQRRKHLRYAIPGAYEFWGQVGPYRLRVLDLSTGGAAFAALPSQRRAYAEGGQFTNVSIELVGGVTVVMDLEVRNVRAIDQGPHEGKFLVATQFGRMDLASRERLTEYLVREWAQYPALASTLFEIRHISR